MLVTVNPMLSASHPYRLGEAEPKVVLAQLCAKSLRARTGDPSQVNNRLTILVFEHMSQPWAGEDLTE
jgi:hypothetical protein